MLATETHATQIVLGDLRIYRDGDHELLSISLRLWRACDAYPVNGCSPVGDEYKAPAPKAITGLDIGDLMIHAQRSLSGRLTAGGFYGWGVAYKGKSQRLDLRAVKGMARTLDLINRAQVKAGDAYNNSGAAVLDSVIAALRIKHWLTPESEGYSCYPDVRWTVRSVADFREHLAQELAKRVAPPLVDESFVA